MKLYKGIDRASENWIEGNDLGLIFATTSMYTAEHYGGRKGVVEFEISEEINLANLNEPDTAEQIAKYATNYLFGFEHLQSQELAAELVGGCEDIEIMDWIATAVLELGYDGAIQNGHVCLFAEYIEIIV